MSLTRFTANLAAGVADAVSLLTRSSIDGSLTQPVGVTRCISTDTDPGPVIVLRDPDCEAAAPLAGASAVTVSPDGAHVYVAAAISRTVVVFARNAITGALSLSSCVSDDLGGDTGGVPAQTECSAAQGLGDPAALATRKAEGLRSSCPVVLLTRANLRQTHSASLVGDSAERAIWL